MRGLFLLLVGSLCLGQEPRGWILGRVVDASGAVVVGAKVHAVNVATNAGASSVTNQAGDYEIPYLLPGTYRVTGELAGFKKSVREGIELRVDDHLRIDLKLQVGDAIESVTVTGETTLLKTEDASPGIVIDERRISDLPIGGGNALYLARLAGGIANTAPQSGIDQSDIGGNPGVLAINGTRTGSSQATLDGISNMSGGGSNFSPPRDLVQEFRINTSPFDASIGHVTGAAVNVSMKSGTNRLHGTSYFYDSRIRAMPWFSDYWLYNPATGPITQAKRDQVKARWLKQQWGDTFTGPVVIPHVYDGHNRTFWSFGYEGLYTRRQTSFTGSVPTPAERDGDFSALLGLGSVYQIYDPASATLAANGRTNRQPLAGNLIPASRIDPIARKMLTYWPAPNSAGAADGTQNYYGIPSIDWDYRAEVGRIDQNFSEKHRMFFRANSSLYYQKTQNMPTIAFGTTTNRPADGVALDDVYVFNPQLLLNLRYGATYMNQSALPFSSGFDLSSLGFSPGLLNQIETKSNPAGVAFPQINVDGLTSPGGGGGNGNTTVYQTLAGTLTKILRTHSLRAGGEFRLLRETGYAYGNVAPALNFSNNFTKGPLDSSAGAPVGQGLASMMFGLPTGGSANVNATRAIQSTFSGFFVQDDWKIAPRLTLNLGLRYEYEGPTTERYNRSIRGFDFTAASPISDQAKANYAKAPIPEIPVSAFSTMGGLTFAGVNGQPRSLWNSDRNNFGPRAGLAFQLTPKTVLRSGYGVFFDLMGIDTQSINQGGFNQSTPVVPSPDNGLTFRATLANPFPDGLLLPTGAAGGLRTFLGQSVTYFNSHPLSPYIQHWTFALQRQLPQRIVMEATYVGTRGTKLAVTRQQDPVPRQYLSTSPVRDQTTINFLTTQVANPFYGIADFTGTNLASATSNRQAVLRPYPQFGGITVNLPGGYSYYHALQMAVEKRFTKGISLQSNWTWSKFMDATNFLNDTDPAPAKVISNLDRTNRFVFSGIYELPLGRNRLLAGWQLQGWYEGQSGQPLGFGNSIFNGNLHDIPIPVDQRRVERWFNTNAGFNRAAGQQLANNIRTFPALLSGVRADGINSLDASLFKNFHVREWLRAQFRMEAYNALNHAQFSPPNTNPTAAAFGTITGEAGGGQRRVTFAIRLMF